MNVKTFQSSDAGAPVLTGQAGTLVSLLDAVLVNGYGTLTVSSITRTGGVATATTSAPHGLAIGSPIPVYQLIAGAAQAEYNGEFLVTPLTADTFSYTVTGTPASPATGSITTKRPSLGWSKPFSGTSKAAYQMPAGTTQHFLQVQDDNSGSSLRSAHWRGYESMSSVDAGIGPFPTSTQQSGKGLWIYKSGTQNATARSWKIIGDEKGFYLHTYPFDTLSSASQNFYFGEMKSFRSGDAFHTMIIAATVESTLTNGSSAPAAGGNPFNSLVTNRGISAGHFCARRYTQIGSASEIGKFGDGATTSIGSAGMPYPNPVDNGYHLGIVKVIDVSLERGLLPGLYQPLHSSALSDGDTVSSIEGLSGRTVLLFEIVGLTNAASRAAFDITGPWR